MFLTETDIIMSNSEHTLNRLYSPTQWSNRGTPEEVLQDYIDRCTQGSEHARLNTQCELNIPYGVEDSNQRIDIYGTDLPSQSPLLVMFHGGYWQMGDRSLMGYIGGRLHKHGIVTVCVGYDLCPTVKVKNIVQQACMAADKILKLAKERQARGVYFMGHSAGAHLVASLLTSNWYKELDSTRQLFSGAILVSGVFDLLPLVSTSVNDALRMSKEETKDISPLFNVNVSVKPARTLVVVGDKESPAFKTQSANFFKVLKDLQWEAQYLEVEHVDHFDIITKLGEEKDKFTHEVLKFMEVLN